jgi:DNA-binding transcriptional MerR regulator
MTESDYQINELAKKAGVSVRTIRFYIGEGLLPSLPSQGRYAVYSEDHLERLELIRLLKDKFLPLKEIRIRLSGISQEDVRAAIAHEKRTAAQTIDQHGTGRSVQEATGRATALDYVNQLLQSQPGGALPAQSPKRSEPPPAKEDLWERVRLAPGVELHIKQPVEPSTRHRLDQLLAYANKLFNL